MTSQELYEIVRREIDVRASTDPAFRYHQQQIAKGNGDFTDSAQCSRILSEILGEKLAKYILELPLNEGRSEVCQRLLKDHFDEVSRKFEQVQTTQDRAKGLDLGTVKPEFPTERVKEVGHSLDDPTEPDETIQRRCKNAVTNVAHSMHDNFVKENAKFRNDLGLKPIIQRYGAGACAWCSAVSGKYRFGEQPDDIFRRHDNCQCTIIYDTQVLRGAKAEDGKRSKTWEEVNPTEIEENAFAPTVLTQEQARQLEERQLQKLGLTSGGNGDRIKLREMANGMRKSPLIPLSEEDKKHILDEIEAIGADPNCFAFRDGFGTAYSDERDVVFVSSNVFPPSDGSKHPRDMMSERAVLAHECYGHRSNRGTKLQEGAWNDEFRASYTAAKECPNLTDEDRAYLILDAIERAHEAGVSIHYNSFMKKVLYG